MTIKGLVEEDFVNYKTASLYICAASCSFKCEKESGVRCCQNSELANAERFSVNDVQLIERYLENPITHAVVFGGLEPLDQIDEILMFIRTLREDCHCEDIVVIYTGYNKTEIPLLLDRLKQYSNLIVKFGRYIPGQQPHYDEVLGVNLASDNQYAVKIS